MFCNSTTAKLKLKDILEEDWGILTQIRMKRVVLETAAIFFPDFSLNDPDTGLIGLLVGVFRYP